jgi:2-hydroxychromene-2-carboxylate isomerase
VILQGLRFVLENGGDVMAFHERMYDAIHKDHINVENPKALAEYASDLVDKDAYLAALESGKYAKAQAEGNDYAYEESAVWYLPAFRMEGKKLDSQGGIGVTKEQIREFLG